MVSEPAEHSITRASARPKRRLLSFTLRGAMLALTLVCIWLGWITDRARKQAAAISQIVDNRGEIGFGHNSAGVMQGATPALLAVSDNDFNPGPLWLRKICGNEYFRTVTAVKFSQMVKPGQISRSARADDLTLFDHFPDLTFVSLNNNRDLTDDGLRRLGNLPLLETLELSNTSIDGSGLDELRRLRRLTSLALARTPIDDDGVANLASLGQLTSIELTRTLITDAAVEQLATMPRLETLSLRLTDVTDACVDTLGRMGQLKALDVRGTYITFDGLIRLMDALPNCAIVPALSGSAATGAVFSRDASVSQGVYDGETFKNFNPATARRVRIYGSGDADRSRFAVLPDMPLLEILRLEGVDISDRGVAGLSRFDNLRQLDLNRLRISDRGVETLAGLRHLERLTLVDAPISDRSVAALARLSQLQSLDLSGTRFTAAGIEKLRQALPQCEIRCIQPTGGK